MTQLTAPHIDASTSLLADFSASELTTVQTRLLAEILCELRLARAQREELLARMGAVTEESSDPPRGWPPGRPDPVPPAAVRLSSWLAPSRAR